MKSIQYIWLGITAALWVNAAQGDSLIEVNKISVNDKYLLVHANYTVLSEEDAGGSIDLTFIDHKGASIQGLPADCSRSLEALNRDNPLWALPRYRGRFNMLPGKS